MFDYGALLSYLIIAADTGEDIAAAVLGKPIVGLQIVCDFQIV